MCQNDRNISQPRRAGGPGAGGGDEVECTRSEEVDPLPALTSGIHLLVLFLNLIHLAARQTGVACWKGFMSVMDAIVRNAKVNMRRGGRKKRKEKREREDFLISKVLPMYHRPCNLTSLPSVITFRARDDRWARAHGAGVDL